MWLTLDAVDLLTRHRSAERTEYQFQFYLNWNIVRAYFDHFYVLRNCVVLYDGFKLTLNKGYNYYYTVRSDDVKVLKSR